MINLKGKRALVCGGTSGIGKSTVDSLVENGADVVVLSRSASGDNTISCDLEDLDTLRELVTKEIEENGNFHILVNNSGGPPSGPIIEAQSNELRKGISQARSSFSYFSSAAFGRHEIIKLWKNNKYYFHLSQRTDSKYWTLEYS